MLKKMTGVLAVAGAVLMGLVAPATASVGVQAAPDCQNDGLPHRRRHRADQGFQR